MMKMHTWSEIALSTEYEEMVHRLQNLEITSLEQLVGLCAATPEDLARVLGTTAEGVADFVEAAISRLEVDDPESAHILREMLVEEVEEYPLGCLDEESSE